jgi:hypothetical protein
MPSLPLSDEDLGCALRAQLHELVVDMVPRPDLCSTVVHQHQGRRRRSRLKGGLATLAVGTAVAVALSTTGTGGGAAPRAQVHLASFMFRLPAGYRSLPSTGKRLCALAIAVFPPPGRPFLGPHRLAAYAKMRSAANADGGCLALLLTAPFRPGTKAASVSPDSARQVRVGPYQAWEGHLPWSEGRLKISALYVLAPSGPANGHPERVVFRKAPAPLVLDVRMPVADGEDRDLVVVSRGLSEQKLVSVVTSGLSSARSTQ